MIRALFYFGSPFGHPDALRASAQGPWRFIQDYLGILPQRHGAQGPAAVLAHAKEAQFGKGNHQKQVLRRHATAWQGKRRGCANPSHLGDASRLLTATCKKRVAILALASEDWTPTWYRFSASHRPLPKETHREGG